MKFLLIPENNSLSHVAKCLAIREALTGRGHEALLAVSRKGSGFLRRLDIPHEIVPDIQGEGEAGFPNIHWFRNPRVLAECIETEAELIARWRPDRLLGVFRFSLKAAAQLAGVPCDSLLCGSMLPEMPETLGFADDETDRDRQGLYLDTFFRYAGARMSRALTGLGLNPVTDIRELLKGERTFLWDTPDFQPLPEIAGTTHVGPIFWDQWPRDRPESSTARGTDSEPLAVVAFGTCVGSVDVARRLVRLLLDMGFRVLLAAGGQTALLDLMPAEPRLTTCCFAPLNQVLPQASLLVSHGGQMSVFEALQHGVPVAVMPFQPEQAHNGVCLERLGCGRRLVGPTPFLGNSEVYLKALAARTDGELRDIFLALSRDDQVRSRLVAARENLTGYRGALAVAEFLEEGGR